MFRSRNLVIVPLVLILGTGGLALPAAQDPKPVPAPVKIGIAPFEDATGGESANAAGGVVKWLRAEMALDKRLLPKVLTAPAEAEGPLDREAAVALGKKAGVETVLMGTILQADVEVSQAGGGSSVLGQIGVGGGLSSAKAEVVLQGELVSVSTGEVLLTERVTGKKTESKLRSDVQTQFGNMDFEGQEAQNGPLGKALKDAVQKLVQAVAQKLTKANADPGANKPQKKN